MAQQDQQRLWSAGTQVQSQAWHSGLTIQGFRSCSFGHDCDSNLISGLGTSHAMGWPKMKKKKEKKKKKQLARQ